MQSNDSFTVDELRMFSLTRLPVGQQMFLLFHKDYFYTQNSSVCFSPCVEKSTGNSGHDNERQKKNLIISIISTETCQTFFITSLKVFFKYLFDNISTGTIGFSVGARGKMTTSVFYARITLRALSWPLTQCRRLRSFFNMKA